MAIDAFRRKHKSGSNPALLRTFNGIKIGLNNIAAPVNARKIKRQQ